MIHAAQMLAGSSGHAVQSVSSSEGFSKDEDDLDGVDVLR